MAKPKTIPAGAKTLSIGGNIWQLSALTFGDILSLEAAVDQLPILDALRQKGRVPRSRFDALMFAAEQQVQGAMPASIADRRTIHFLFRTLRGAPLVVATSIAKTSPLFFEETLQAEVEKAGGLRACMKSLLVAAGDVLDLSELIDDGDEKKSDDESPEPRSTSSSPNATA